MAINRILNEIKKLTPLERNKLRIILDTEEIKDLDIKLSKKAAGGWADIDADKMIEDIYRNRENSSRRIGADW